MGLLKYKSQPAEAIRLGIAACAAGGVKLDVDVRLLALCCRYSSGGKPPDYGALSAPPVVRIVVASTQTSTTGRRQTTIE
jgi:hypothetical protein